MLTVVTKADVAALTPVSCNEVRKFSLTSEILSSTPNFRFIWTELAYIIIYKPLKLIIVQALHLNR